jgi:hypothetical protein
MSMFDVQQQIENEMLSNAKDVANLPVGRVGLYSASVQGDMYNQGLMSLAGLMGGSPDPRIGKEQALQSIFEEYGNPETPEEAVAVADALLAEGFNAEAQQFMKFSVELRNSMPKANKPAVEIEKFNEAVKGGYKGTFFQYQVDLKKAGTDSNVQFGSIPAGYEMFQNKNGGYEMKVVKGGPADKEQIELSEKKVREQVRQQMKGNLVLKNINLAREKINNPETIFGMEIGVTSWGALLKDVPGSPAKAVDKILGMIRANIGFAELNDMRKASPTGGALGQVSERELEFLQSVIGSLEQSQSKEDVLRVLGDIEYWYNYIVHGPTFNQDVPEDTNPAEVTQ